jgi:hypothetical protein
MRFQDETVFSPPPMNPYPSGLFVLILRPRSQFLGQPQRVMARSALFLRSAFAIR